MYEDDLRLYRWMEMCLQLDTTLAALNPRWFPVEGEEATLVGGFFDLRADDAVAPHYRDPFVVYLMRGAELWRLVSQVLGKATGYNKGRSVPFTGPIELNIVPWVAGDLGTTIGTATGAALAFQQERSDRVCVCSFGDGTSNRGDFHENINLAASWKLPIVYICQNNGWAISQRADSYLPAPIAARAAGYGIPGITIDGCDVELVRRTVGEAVARARSGAGPTLIEARTQRVHGHWAGDRASYRGSQEEHRRSEALSLFADRLLKRHEAIAADLQAIHDEVKNEVAQAVTRAQAAPDAGATELGREEVLL